MMQTRLSSLIEAVINVVIGFVISLAITAVVLPAYGHQVTWSENLQITLIFTATSILRTYFVRRYFNARIHSAELRMADSAHQFD
jgi:predicted membrane protein